MKRLMMFATFVLSTVPLSAEESCYDKVEIGDPVHYVIEHCGEPVRSERDIYSPAQPVEVIRGAETVQHSPAQPQRMEKWYYDTSLNKATLIEIQDGGVIDKRRLERMQDNTSSME